MPSSNSERRRQPHRATPSQSCVQSDGRAHIERPWPAFAAALHQHPFLPPHSTSQPNTHTPTLLHKPQYCRRWARLRASPAWPAAAASAASSSSSLLSSVVRAAARPASRLVAAPGWSRAANLEGRRKGSSMGIRGTCGRRSAIEAYRGRERERAVSRRFYRCRGGV